MITHKDIRAARKTAGKTQELVAGVLGISEPYLSDIERGRRPWQGWSRKRLELLAGAINIDADDLISSAMLARVIDLIEPGETWEIELQQAQGRAEEI